MGLLRPARPQGAARLHRHRAGGVDRGQQLRRPGGRGRRRWAEVDLRADAAAVDVQPGRGGRPVRRGAPGGRRLRPRAVRPPDPGLRAAARLRAAVHPHRAGPRVLRGAVRDALPAALLRPGVPARVRRCDGELRLRDLGRRHPAPPRADHQRVAVLHQRAAARDGPHVVRQHRDDALVGRPLAQRGLRRVRLHVGSRASDGVRRHRGQQPRRRQALRLPRRPGPQLAPDPPAGAHGGRCRVDLRLHHLPQGRGGAQAAHVLRGRGRLLHRHECLLRRARLGQHHPRRPRRLPRAGQRPRPPAVAQGLARDRRRRPAGCRAHRRRPGADRRRSARGTRTRRWSAWVPTAAPATCSRRWGRPAWRSTASAPRSRGCPRPTSTW